MDTVSIFWMRRDLRLADNTALKHALASKFPVVIVYIFDPELLRQWQPDNARVTFIHDRLSYIHDKLGEKGSGLLMMYDSPQQAVEQLMSKYTIHAVFANKDYEPSARQRDASIGKFLASNNISFHLYKDQVIFEEGEITKDDGKPYTVYTPYKKKWRSYYQKHPHNSDLQTGYEHLYNHDGNTLSLEDIGCRRSALQAPRVDLDHLTTYSRDRDYPAKDATTHLSVYLRFGTISIRELVSSHIGVHDGFVDELIWREFFMQILFHFPHVVDASFRPDYDAIQWRNDEHEFDLWCKGETGYPIVDAGIRELLATGYMHNRVRMIVASFLCKDLLIDWRWGERFFAEKLLDYELASNNGNWQWAAGSGCDAAPYFRIFNPHTQFEKFDPQGEYVKKWVPEYGTDAYRKPMVDHDIARKRTLEAYKKALDTKKSPKGSD